MFGVVFKSVIVIGAVYALSPSRADGGAFDGSKAVRDFAASAAVSATAKAAPGNDAPAATSAMPSLDDLLSAATRICASDAAACAGLAKAASEAVTGTVTPPQPASIKPAAAPVPPAHGAAKPAAAPAAVAAVAPVATKPAAPTAVQQKAAPTTDVDRLGALIEAATRGPAKNETKNRAN